MRNPPVLSLSNISNSVQADDADVCNGEDEQQPQAVSMLPVYLQHVPQDAT